MAVAQQNGGGWRQHEKKKKKSGMENGVSKQARKKRIGENQAAWRRAAN